VVEPPESRKRGARIAVRWAVTRASNCILWSIDS
jgi:hypothetical protein